MRKVDKSGKPDNFNFLINMQEEYDKKIREGSHIVD